MRAARGLEPLEPEIPDILARIDEFGGLAEDLRSTELMELDSTRALSRAEAVSAAQQAGDE